MCRSRPVPRCWSPDILLLSRVCLGASQIEFFLITFISEALETAGFELCPFLSCLILSELPRLDLFHL